MKFVPRVLLPTVFVLISSTAFADTLRLDLNSNVSIGPNVGAGDNVSVVLFGQGDSLGAIGGTPFGFFDCCDPQQYLPGSTALGFTSVFWDTAELKIGSTVYEFDTFDLFPTDINAPSITFPTNGKNVTVSFPWVWELDGTILPGGNQNTECPSSGCNFSFASKLGTLSFSFIFSEEFGAYFPGPASFKTPEPATLPLMLIGIGAFGWRKFRVASLARGRSVIPV